MASMNVKMLEECLFHSNLQQFSRTNMGLGLGWGGVGGGGGVGVGLGVFEACDV
jgi:hypothetical protein